MLQKMNLILLIVFTFIMSLLMVAINKTMDYFSCKNYLPSMNIMTKVFLIYLV